MAGKKKIGKKKAKRGTHIVPAHLMGKTLRKKVSRKRSRKA